MRTVRRLACLGCGGALALLALPATAQRPSEAPIGGRTRDFSSPQHFALEFRGSPFTPDIDSDPKLNGATPYKDIFGTSPRPLLSVELDWEALRIPHLGTVGPGLSVGYAWMSDPAPLVNPMPGKTSAESTTIQIFPFYGVLVLRADVFYRDWRIPVMPYGKAGVVCSLWRASNDLGTSSYLGVSGTGHSIGSHFALGLAVNLNPLDPYAARQFDNAMGVNNSYIFAEWTHEDMSGLGLQSNPLRVGGTSWTFGLAFEF